MISYYKQTHCIIYYLSFIINPNIINDSSLLPFILTFFCYAHHYYYIMLYILSLLLLLLLLLLLIPELARGFILRFYLFYFHQ